MEAHSVSWSRTTKKTYKYSTTRQKSPRVGKARSFSLVQSFMSGPTWPNSYGYRCFQLLPPLHQIKPTVLHLCLGPWMGVSGVSRRLMSWLLGGFSRCRRSLWMRSRMLRVWIRNLFASFIRMERLTALDLIVSLTVNCCASKFLWALFGLLYEGIYVFCIVSDFQSESNVPCISNNIFSFFFLLKHCTMKYLPNYTIVLSVFFIVRALYFEKIYPSIAFYFQ